MENSEENETMKFDDLGKDDKAHDEWKKDEVIKCVSPKEDNVKYDKDESAQNDHLKGGDSLKHHPENRDVIYNDAEENEIRRHEREERAEMRERYLRLLSFLTGRQVDLSLYEQTNVSGKFSTMKSNQTHYIINSLQTPIGEIRHAILRMSDTLVISSSDLSGLPPFRSTVS